MHPTQHVPLKISCDLLWLVQKYCLSRLPYTMKKKIEWNKESSGWTSSRKNWSYEGVRSDYGSRLAAKYTSNRTSSLQCSFLYIICSFLPIGVYSKHTSSFCMCHKYSAIHSMHAHNTTLYMHIRSAQLNFFIIDWWTNVHITVHLWFNLPWAERKEELIFFRCSLPWNQPKPLTMRYVEWWVIAGIYSSGKKKA